MAHTTFDPHKIRQDFPILSQEVRGKRLIYLDSAATTQKPQVVIDRIQHYYTHENANVHRGLHYLSETATAAMEAARQTAQQFLNATKPEEIIFTKGCTNGLNLLAYSLASLVLKPSDEILITAMEHHANIVPWQLACDRTGATLKVIPIHEDGRLNLEEARALFSENTKIFSCVHISNTLGTINPIEELISIANSVGAISIIDGAQAVSHVTVDVQSLDCDFYVFSGHKLFGPTGTGILYGKEHWLEKMPPFESGGDMIETVRFEKSTFAQLPAKFEAGTPNIAGNIALGAAIEYLTQFDMADIQQHEQQLVNVIQNQLDTRKNALKIIGNAQNKTAICTIYSDMIHPHDLSTLLDFDGIAIRAGHHCTMPLMDFYQVPATVRASFAFYNTLEEVDLFFEALDRAIESFS